MFITSRKQNRKINVLLQFSYQAPPNSIDALLARFQHCHFGSLHTFLKNLISYPSSQPPNFPEAAGSELQLPKATFLLLKLKVTATLPTPSRGQSAQFTPCSISSGSLPHSSVPKVTELPANSVFSTSVPQLAIFSQPASAMASHVASTRIYLQKEKAFNYCTHNHTAHTHTLIRKTERERKGKTRRETLHRPKQTPACAQILASPLQAEILVAVLCIRVYSLYKDLNGVR